MKMRLDMRATMSSMAGFTWSSVHSVQFALEIDISSSERDRTHPHFHQYHVKCKRLSPWSLALMYWLHIYRKSGVSCPMEESDKATMVPKTHLAA